MGKRNGYGKGSDGIELETREQDVLESQMESQRREDLDSAALRRVGKNPVLKRKFSFLSMLGFSCLVLGTWQAIFTTFGIGFENGGPSGVVYTFLIVWAGTLATFISLAELSSMVPTAGGQYHWVSILAPPFCQKLFSYVVGWLTVAGWQAALASSVYLEGVLVQNLIELTQPSYEPHLWHGTLLCYACLTFCVFINTAVGHFLPQIESVLLVFYLLGFCGVLVPLLYLAPHGNAASVFNNFSNGGGWPTQGLSFFVGIAGNAYAFAGADSAYHMSEEVKNATIVVPRSIVYGLLLNGTVGFGMVLALLFCLGDPSVLAETTYTYPFVAIFKQGVKSIAGSAVMTAIILVIGLGLDIGIMTAASRMLWSFARDRGVPGWRYISRIGTTSNLPIIAIFVTTILSVLLGLISIGSSVAFNDVVSIALGGQYASYFITVSLLLWRRVSGSIKTAQEMASENISQEDYNLPGSAGRLVWGPWRVPGLLGTAVNAFACVYLAVVWFFVFWPPTAKVDGASMNYASLLLGFVAIVSAIYYAFWARKSYKGPIVDKIEG